MPKTIDKQDRDRVIAAAIQDGKFAASRRSLYEQAWAKNPEATRHLLTAAANEGGLVAGLVPGTAGATAGHVHVGSDQYPPHWFPELREAANRAEITGPGPANYPDHWFAERRFEAGRITRVA